MEEIGEEPKKWKKGRLIKKRKGGFGVTSCKRVWGNKLDKDREDWKRQVQRN